MADNKERSILRKSLGWIIDSPDKLSSLMFVLSCVV